jgi:hypothetical protein
VAFAVLDMAPKRASLDLDFAPKVEVVPGAVRRRRNCLVLWINFTVTNTLEGLHERLWKPHRPQAHKPTPLLRHHG